MGFISAFKGLRHHRGKSFRKFIEVGLGHFVPVINYAPANYNAWDRKGASPFIINLR